MTGIRRNFLETKMAEFTVRKITVIIEEILHEGGPPPAKPRLRAAAMALVSNPFAGRYEPDLGPAMDDLMPITLELTDKVIAALGGDPSIIDGYGKAAVAGSAGELEHAVMFYVPAGKALRDRLGKALAIVPSAVKVGGFGARVDVPLGHTNAAYVRSHFDAMEVGMPDGPRPDEILLCLAMSCGGRVHSRLGGLEADQISVWDGQR